MATKNTQASDAPAEVTPETPVDEVVAPQPRRRGLRIAAIVAGGVLAAGLLFGGGVVLGLTLPDGDGPGMSQGQLLGGERPGGERPEGAPQGGPQNGGQPPAQQDDDTDSDSN